MKQSVRHEQCANLTAAASLILTLAAPLSAGTVTFDPPALTVHQGETARFDLIVSETSLADFDLIEMYPYLLDPPGPFNGFFMSFDYAPGFVDSADWVYLCWLDCFSLGIGAFQISSPAFSAPLMIGTLNVYTTSLQPGTYLLLISSSFELDQFGAALSGLDSQFAARESLEGAATLTIVPEPASLLPLTVAAAVLLRPRVINPRHRCNAL